MSFKHALNFLRKVLNREITSPDYQINLAFEELDHFHKEQGLLFCLTEEAGEIVRIAGKYGRFGRYSYNPHDPDKKTNLQELGEEIGNFLEIVDMLNIPPEYIQAGRASKTERLATYGINN